MIVNYSPQRSDRQLSYEFAGEKIIATLDGQVDTFDFSSMPDGEAEEIASTLPICPVVSAKRVDGELEVTLLRFHGPNPTPEEAYPEPEVV